MKDLKEWAAEVEQDWYEALSIEEEMSKGRDEGQE